MVTRQDAINDALARLKGIEFTMEPGFSEHGPMVAEAISSLGRNDRIAPWVDRYIAHYRHVAAPPLHEPIDGADEGAWRGALGDVARLSDWFAYFRVALSEAPWQDTIRTWVPRLLDGYIGGLTHGLLRTSHAVRALPEGGEPSALQRDELARGLAYWAGSFARLPGDPDLHGTKRLDEALDALPRGPGAAIATTVESLAATENADRGVKCQQQFTVPLVQQIDRRRDNEGRPRRPPHPRLPPLSTSLVTGSP